MSAYGEAIKTAYGSAYDDANNATHITAVR